MARTYLVCEECGAIAESGTDGWQEGDRQRFEFPDDPHPPLMPRHVVRCPDHAIQPIRSLEDAAGRLAEEYDRTLGASGTSEPVE